MPKLKQQYIIHDTAREAHRLGILFGCISAPVGRPVERGYPVLPDGPDITLIGDKGYDSDDYPATLRAKGITACIPPRKGRNSLASFCKI